MSEEAEAAPEETTGRGDGLTLGSRLRAARESHELSIEKIADELRIEEHVLVALEEDRLDDINVAPVFIKGYIKQYGRLLRLDYDVLRRAFYEQIDTDDVRLQPNSSIQLRDERQITIWIIAAVAVLLVGVALFVWWLGTDDVSVSGLLGDVTETSDAVTAVPQSTRELRLSEPARSAGRAADAADEVLAEGAPGADAPGSVAPSEPAETLNAGDVNAFGGSAERGAQDGQVRQEAPRQAGEITTAALAAPVPGSIPMVFEFSAESWFELEDANGRRLFYDLARPGSELRFVPLPPARVLIGNAAAVSITVDSQAYAIPAGSLRGNVASFVIDPVQD